MGKAIGFSLICVLAFIGLRYIFEMLEQFLHFKVLRPTVLFCKIAGHAEDVELQVRSLSASADRVCAGGTVFIVDGGMDSETRELCRRAANQFSNVFVGVYDDGAFLLDP